jgi:hypothetical protein
MISWSLAYENFSYIEEKLYKMEKNIFEILIILINEKKFYVFFSISLKNFKKIGTLQLKYCGKLSGQCAISSGKITEKFMDSKKFIFLKRSKKY